MNSIKSILKEKLTIPFEPISILKDLNVSIESLNLNSPSIAILEKKGNNIVLSIRKDIYGFKKTFLLSQQIARISLGQLDKTSLIEIKDLNIERPSSLLDEVANEETIELLTPKKEIKKIIEISCDIEELADYFGVLEPFMYSRLKSLKVITD